MAKKEGSDQIGGIALGTFNDRGMVVKSGGVFTPVAQDQYAVTTVVGTLTLANESRIYANATSGAFVINLPPAASWTGKTYVIKKIDSSNNNVTIDASGAELIDSSLTKVLTATDPVVTISSDGAVWRTIGGGGSSSAVFHHSWDVFSNIIPLTAATYLAENIGIAEQASNALTIFGYTDKAITAGTLTVTLYRTPPGGSRTAAFSMTMTSGNTTSGVYRTLTGITSALVVGDLIDVEVSTDALFNFTGSGTLQLNVQSNYAFPASPSGGSGTIVVQDEGSGLAGGPHTTLNFTGTGVTAVDAGGGVATITVTSGSSSLTEFDSISPSNFDTPIIENTEVIDSGDVTVSTDADGLLNVQVISQLPLYLANGGFEIAGGTANDADQWTFDTNGQGWTDYATTLRGRQTGPSNTGAGNWNPTEGSFFWMFGRVDSHDGSSFPMSWTANAYAQIRQQINFTSIDTVTFKWGITGQFSGRISVYASSSTVPSYNTSTERVFTFTPSSGNNNTVNTATVDVTSVTGDKWLIIRIERDGNVGSFGTSAFIDDVVISPTSSMIPGRVFIPIKTSSWAYTADNLLKVVAGISSGGAGSRVGLAFRFQDFESGGYYLVDWDLSEGAIKLRRGASGVFTDLASYPGDSPTLSGVTTRMKHVLGGADGNILIVGKERVLDFIRETASPIASVGQWGIYLETVGVGTTNFKFGRVTGLDTDAVAL